MADRPPLIPDEIAQRTFATSFRGFDPAEVRSFLARLAEQLRGVDARQVELTARLAAAEERVKHPQLDVETLTTALGEETARILRSAQDAAQDIRAKAEENIAQLLREAYEEASRIRAEAEVVLARETEAAETVASGIRVSAEDDAAATRDRARQEAERLLGEVEAQTRSMIEEARTTRARVLADLARRRRLGHTQVEQLRAGRERLLGAYRLVRTTLDEVTEELLRAESEAREAAEEAARRTLEEPAAEEAEPAFDEERAPVSEPESVSAVVVETASDAEPDVGSVEEAVPEPTPEPDPEPRPDIEGRRNSSVRILRRPKTPDAPRPGPKAEPETKAEPESNQAFDPAPPPPDGTEGVRLLRPQPASARRLESPRRPEPEPASEPEPEPTSVSTPESTGAPAAVPSAVDELFARIRADRTAASPVPVEEPTAVPAEGSAVPADESPLREAESSVPADESPVPDEDETLLQRRDGALEDVRHRLARRLKRALQDEQNDVLDRLRVRRDRPRAEVLLPPEDEHPARYRDEAAALLTEAAEAGAQFVDLPPGAVSVEDLAASLATDVVGPLRRRLERSLEEGADEDQALVVERIGAAYREVKGRRIEQLAADHVVAAFSRGSVTATPEGAAFRWVVDDDGGPCPDCDDNALAGPTPRGESFPTGQAHPPAHAGCRCLLVPATG